LPAPPNHSGASVAPKAGWAGKFGGLPGRSDVWSSHITRRLAVRLLTCLDYPGVLAVVVHREAPLRWSFDEEVLMSSHSSKTTTNHDEIRRWADARGAKPACVKGTGGNGDPGMIRLDFPGYSGSESLQQISWDEWFKAFDANDLALVYQDRTADGARSNFNKLVSRDTAEARAEGDSHASAHSHSHSHSNSHSHSHEHRHDSRS
jgi:hypothetical protein